MKKVARFLLLLLLRVMAVGILMLWATSRLGALAIAYPVGGSSFGLATTSNGLIIGTEPSSGATQFSWKFRSYLAAADEQKLTMENVFENPGNLVRGHAWTIASPGVLLLGMSYPASLFVVITTYLMAGFLFRKRRRRSLLDD